MNPYGMGIGSKIIAVLGWPSVRGIRGDRDGSFIGIRGDRCMARVYVGGAWYRVQINNIDFFNVKTTFER